MSKSILDLPTEISDYIFGYLRVRDQKNARLVCSQWNHLLSSPRYYKNTRLRWEPGNMRRINDDLLRAAGKGKIHCIEVSEWSTPSEEEIVFMVQLFEASRFSLETLSLRYCSEFTMRSIFDALGKMLRLRHLIVDCAEYIVSVPKVPTIITGSAGFSLITHLEVDLFNESFVELVRSLAKQLTCLVLSVNRENLLVRCLNKSHLSALKSLTLCFVNLANMDTIKPGELGDGCWRMLAQLETLRCSRAPVLDLVLPEMFRHCQNLKCLAIDQCQFQRNVDQINSFKGLKELSLCDNRPSDNFSEDLPPTISSLFDLEHLYLSTEINIRLGTHLPKLTSVVIERPIPRFYKTVEGLLSQIKNIDGIQGRRFRKFHFKCMHLDRQVIEMTGSLSIDVLTFEDCGIDGSLLDFLVETETRRTILKILMDGCLIIPEKGKSYNVRTIPELRAKCPRLQIAVNGNEEHFYKFIDEEDYCYNYDDDGNDSNGYDDESDNFDLCTLFENGF